MAAHIGPLLLQLPVLGLQELRQAWLGPLGSAKGVGGQSSVGRVVLKRF